MQVNSHQKSLLSLVFFIFVSDHSSSSSPLPFPKHDPGSVLSLSTTAGAALVQHCLHWKECVRFSNGNWLIPIIALFASFDFESFLNCSQTHVELGTQECELQPISKCPQKIECHSRISITIWLSFSWRRDNKTDHINSYESSAKLHRCRYIFSVVDVLLKCTHQYTAIIIALCLYGGLDRRKGKRDTIS